MKKLAVSGAALLGAAVLTGSTILPGSATTAVSEIQTKRLVANSTAFHNLGKFTGAGTDVLRSRRAGKIVGYDAISTKYFPKRREAVVHVALALKGGIILSRLSELPTTDGIIRYRGPILSGSGKYKGIDGIVNAHSPANNPGKTFVTLRYQW